MNKEEILKRAEAFTKECLAGEGTGHDWWHIERVLNNARLIMKEEDADTFVVELAVLLHDVGDRKVVNKPENDYTIPEGFLREQHVPDEIVEQVMFIIKNMSFSTAGAKKLEHSPIEFQIVQDADRLDALGAIGIARAFAYGGKTGRSLHDPSAEPRENLATPQAYGVSDSTIQHFYEKLLLLKDLMNTKAARAIAQERHKFVELFLEQFLAEWEGKR